MPIWIIVIFAILALLSLLILAAVIVYFSARGRFDRESRENLAKLGGEAPLLTEDGFQFRDLNKNGKLDIYEDSRQPIEARVEDLLGQMTLEEKAGMLFQPMIASTPDGELTEAYSNFMTPEPTSKQVVERNLRHFNILGGVSPKAMAKWYNKLQKMAERTRLGIPVSVSSDPRHSRQANVGAALTTEGFSAWPDPIGFAAIGDPAIVEEFGDIARQEYLATGIRVALHPMADLATEPRWARINGTFGEDADMAAALTTAYINGFQNGKVGVNSVCCMLKHFPGGGPQKDGLDAHFPYGKEQVYPGNNFEYHLIPFEHAFENADVQQIMPYYGIPVGQTSEDVGMSFNKEIITDLLRVKYGYEGIICTDWMIAETQKMFGFLKLMDSTSWGVEDLSPLERYEKALNCGVDQFGGQYQNERILELVEAGKISEERIDQSVRRLLRMKFLLGLFDDPYVDEEQAELLCGNQSFRAKGKEAMRKSCVLLKNARVHDKITLPLASGVKVYCENIDKDLVKKYGGQPVFAPDEAEIAILRLAAPYEKIGNGFLERMFHQGDLDFKSPEKEHILELMEMVPTIVDIYLDRPAVIPEISRKAAALIGSFNVSDDVILDILFGKFNPVGKLPFELPSSMEAVKEQKEDVPHDSKAPLYPFGFGLRY
ncbi:MAG: glycoside hydrolase family 3 N-terminal domain-containing protein [Anaerolineae bacterium]|jgi:beta-glucosidase|nr:glycoside hydrolase family 3 N-terminal domain-containing protein [Anaerolineae bacterium]